MQAEEGGGREDAAATARGARTLGDPDAETRRNFTRRAGPAPPGSSAGTSAVSASH